MAENTKTGIPLFQRLLLGGALLFIVCLSALVALFYALPGLVESRAVPALDSMGVSDVELNVERIHPWGARLGAGRLEAKPYGLRARVDSIELTYDPVELLRARQIEALSITAPELWVDLERLQAGLAAPIASVGESGEPGSPAGGLQVPLDRFRLSDGRVHLLGRQGEESFEGNLLLTREGDMLGGTAAFTKTEWGLEGRLLGTFDEARQVWSGNLRGEAARWRELLLFARPEARGWLDSAPELALNRVSFELQASGAADGPALSRAGLLFETGPATIHDAGSGLRVDLHGVGGAALVNPPDWGGGSYRVHARVDRLVWGERLESRAFAVESVYARDGSVLVDIGPLALRYPGATATGRLSLAIAGLADDRTPGLDFEGERWTIAWADGAGGSLESEWQWRGRVEQTGADAWNGLLEARAALPSGRVKGLDLEAGELDLSVKGTRLKPGAFPAPEHGTPPSWPIEPVATLLNSLEGELSVKAARLSAPSGPELRALDARLLLEPGGAGDAWVDAHIRAEEGAYSPWRIQGLELEAKVGWKETAWSASGTLNGGIALALAGELRHGDGPDGPLEFQAELSPSRFEDSWITSDLFPELPYVEWSGALTGRVSGTLGADGRNLDGTGEMLLEDLSATSSTLDFDLSGGRTALALERLAPVLSEAGQVLEIAFLRKGKVELENIRVQYEILDAETLVVSEITADGFGGRLRSTGFAYDISNPGLDFAFGFEDVEAARVLALAEDFPGLAEATLRGWIQVDWDGREVRFRQSFLEMSQQGGVLKLNLDRRSAAEGSPAYNILENLGASDVAVESLRHLVLEQARLDLFNHEQPDAPNVLRLVGTSRSVQPNAPVDITLNFRGDVEAAIRQVLDLVLNTRRE